MVENPATWGTAENVVTRVLASFDLQTRRGVIGLSLPRQICDALREANLLQADEPKPPARRS